VDSHIKIIYAGKARDLDLKELWLNMKFGCKVVCLEPDDFISDTYYNRGGEQWIEPMNS